jgi:2-polyprenyl-6-hydroxyphenyl methylase/3-demethylubiquinone-9 3-methyltransferase
MKTVIDSEISKFSHNKWWDETAIESKMLHKLNILRAKYIQKFIDIKNIEVLDIGCGGGIASETMSRAGAIVTGVDASNDAIAIAKQHANEMNLKINYINSSIEELDTKQYDAIFANDIIEHVSNPRAFIEEANKRLKPNGLLFISTINRNSASMFFAKFIAEYALKLVPKGVHEYKMFIKPSEVNEYTKHFGKILDSHGFTYNPIMNQFVLIPSTLVNYFTVIQKFDVNKA